MMRKISKITAAFFAFAFSLSLVGCGENQPDAEYAEAVYGTMYYLPYSEEGYTVYDSENNEVSLDKSNGFFVEDTEGYTFRIGDGKKVYEISIRTSGTERFQFSYEKEYFAVGTEVELPKVIALDEAGKEMPYTVSLKKGEESVSFENGVFTPESTGTYVYTARADHHGETVEKSAVVEVVEKSSYKLRLVAELGEEYGMNQAFNFFGYTPEFTTEKAYGRDSGSLKVTLTNDRTYNQQFSVRNLFIKDLTKCTELYFYVYNDSDYNLQLSVNLGSFPVITPHRWTKISITDFAALTAWSHSDVIKNNFNLECIEGLTICDFLEEWTGMGKFSLYFSSIYTWSEPVAEDVVDGLENLPDAFTQDDVYDFEDLREMFTRLTDEEKWENKGVYQSAMRKYTAFLKADNGLVEEENVSVYFDREFGLKQVSAVDCDLALDKTVLYDGRATTKVSLAEQWEATVRMDYPVISDCTAYDELYIYILCDGDFEEDIMATFSYNTEEDSVLLKKGEWVKVSFSDWENSSVSDKANVYGVELDFYVKDWADCLPAGVSVHISCLYAG